MMVDNLRNKPINFWQQNVNKSLTAQLDLLNHADPKIFDFIFIQEPHIDFLKLTRANHHWTVVYPTSHLSKPETSRSITLVNSKMSKNRWKQIQIPSNDVTAVEITCDLGTLSFYNIYNACEHSDTLLLLQDFWDQRRRSGDTSEKIWLGDFNRHHPLWDDPNHTHLFTSANLDSAALLINLLGAHDMEMALPASTPTIETFRTGSLSRPDNVFCSPSLSSRFIKCDTKPEHRPACTDHFPIIGVIDHQPERSDLPPRRNWRAVEWDSFRKALQANLDAMGPAREIRDAQDFHLVFNLLTGAIQSAADQHVPSLKLSPYTKRWWSPELTALRKKKCHLKAKSYRLRAQLLHPVHEEARHAASEYASKIECAKKKHWEDWLERVDTENVWTAHKYINGTPTDGGITRIPTLKTTANGTPRELDNNEDKSKLLYETFFPPPPTDPLADHPTEYPPPVCEFIPITDQQIIRAIRRLSPFKAPGPNGICNVVFIKCADMLVQWMGHLFRATFTFHVFPDEWLTSKTVVIRKPGRPDYSAPKAYRPIALLDTMSKILSSCVTETLVWIAMSHNLLPSTHFGGLPGRSTTDSLHLLTKFVHDAWAHPSDRYVSLFFLDVKAAFPSVVPELLFHNMRKRGIPTQYIEWYRMRLTGRKTTLCFDDYISSLFDIFSGIDQGCPISPIGFLFYNADILEVPNRQRGEIGFGFIDDVGLGARGPTQQAANAKVKSMMERRGGCIEWSRTHHVNFEMDKNASLQPSRLKEKLNNGSGKLVPIKRYPIVIEGRTTLPSKAHKFLGVIIDEELRFKEQVASAVAKGTKYALACRRLAKPSVGIQQKYTRLLFNSVVVPKMLYGVDVWGARMVAEPGKKGGKGGQRSLIERVVRAHALTSSGAMSTTATDAAVAHANLTPTLPLLRKICLRAYLRMTTLPPTNPIYKEIRQAARQRKKHKSPLHFLAKTFNIHPKTVEDIRPSRHPPNWIPKTRVTIADNKEDATTAVTNATEVVQVFTDGSGIDGGIGAAAILRRRGKPDKCLRFHLGSDRNYTVYNGEQVGMILGLTLLLSEDRVPSVFMGVDNQAAIQATLATYSHSGHTLTDLFISLLDRTLEKHDLPHLDIWWVPGHADIPGNEAVDMEAKKAARGDTSPPSQLPPALKSKGRPISLPLNKSALLQTLNKSIKSSIIADFSSTARGRRLRSIDQSMPSGKFATLINNLPRRHASALCQLRTGHIPLNSHLARIGKADSPACPKCGANAETVRHFVLVCPAHLQARRTLERKVGRSRMKLEHLLTSAKSLPHLLRFLNSTERLRQTFGNLIPPTLAEPHPPRVEEEEA